MSKLELLILASGSGSTGEALFNRAALVITNNPDVGVIQRAEKYGIPYKVMRRKDYLAYGKGIRDEASKLIYGQAMIEEAERYGITHISQNGWSIPTPENVITAFRHKIANSHPAPLDSGYPDFGGVGMTELAPHEAVIYYAQRVPDFTHTEITIHEVEPEYDAGLPLMIERVLIQEGDTAEILQERVKESERNLLVRFWDSVAETGEFKPLSPRTTRLIRPEYVGVYYQAFEAGLAKLHEGK